ncbi:MAG TPA: hypothetical protein VFD44_05845 [Hanamia sp.]|nr:hypothetical protein [Hanamia sp.]
MKLKIANNHSGIKAVMSSVLMLSLALMLLIFSCPVKKMLTRMSAQTTSAIRTNQTNQPEVNNGDEDITINSCSFKKDANIIKFTVSREFKSFQPVLSIHDFHSGSFSSPNYLDATSGCFKTGNPVSYTLPLFLRHSSLLI